MRWFKNGSKNAMLKVNIDTPSRNPITIFNSTNILLQKSWSRAHWFREYETLQYTLRTTKWPFYNFLELIPIYVIYVDITWLDQLIMHIYTMQNNILFGVQLWQGEALLGSKAFNPLSKNRGIVLEFQYSCTVVGI